jgi:hypothetical protein
MLKFTLDHNCIVALDENRDPEAGCLRSLLAKHEAGTADVRLVATSASERQQKGPYLENFGEFRARLEALGLGHLELLAPVLTVDVSYIDWCIVAGDDDIALLKRIHSVLFAGHPFDLQDALGAAGGRGDVEVVEQKWRRRALDVDALWCHIHYKGDIFVTSDGNCDRVDQALIDQGPDRSPHGPAGDAMGLLQVALRRQHAGLGVLARGDVSAKYRRHRLPRRRHQQRQRHCQDRSHHRRSPTTREAARPTVNHLVEPPVSCTPDGSRRDDRPDRTRTAARTHRAHPGRLGHHRPRTPQPGNLPGQSSQPTHRRSSRPDRPAALAQRSRPPRRRYQHR